MPQHALAFSPARSPVAEAVPVPRHVAIAKGADIIIASLADVRYFRAEGKSTRVLLAAEEGLLKLGIGTVEQQLPLHMFLKVHRGFVVNLDLVCKACRDDFGRMYLCLHARQERVPVSRVYEHLFRVGLF